MAANVWINEIDYDMPGGDAAEFIEFAGDAGTSLSNWRIILYDGSTGFRYSTLFFDLTISDSQNGKGVATFAYDPDGILNGPLGGIALIDNNSNVVQFLSYGGSFIAADGLAQGMRSTNIGVVDSSTDSGSLQLTGDGSTYEDFTWQFVGPATAGAINSGQTLGNFPATFSGDTSGDVQDMVDPVATGTLVVTDTDSATDVIAQENATSDNGYGTFSIDANGKWTFRLASGNDVVTGLSNVDTISDFLTVETADGTVTQIHVTITGITEIVGSPGDDGVDAPVAGTTGADLVRALGGRDFVYGLGGPDYLMGGAGADQLFGGELNDTFIFDDGDSGLKASKRDAIRDFRHSQDDLIDLSDIDGKTSSGADDPLVLADTEKQALAKAGRLWVDETGRQERTIFINSDSDKEFDLAIDVDTKDHLSIGDFTL